MEKDLSSVQKYIGSLSMEEIWQLWKENICFEGVYLDSVLKQKIEDEGRKTKFQKYGGDSGPPYFHEYSIYCSPGENYHHICYLWLDSRLWNEVYCRLDQTFLRRDGRFAWTEPRYVGFKGRFRREANKAARQINQIDIIADTNGLEHPGNNDFQFISFDCIPKHGLVWGSEVKNLTIEISEGTLMNNRYIDIPISCYSCNFLLRILLAPYSFSYEVQPDGSIWLNKCFTKYITAVTIPLMIDGKKVSRIGKRCFYCCSDVVSVTIPEGIKSIGSFAFEGCSSLEKISIPKSVEDIGRYAFRYCEKLSSVIFLGAIQQIRSYTFSCCRSLSEFVVPDGCERIGYKAFAGSGLARVVVSKTVKKLGFYAFYCDNLSVALPYSLEDYLMARAKRCWMGWKAGETREEEMDYPVAWEIFAHKSEFNRKGTLLVFYDDNYQVVKQIAL